MAMHLLIFLKNVSRPVVLKSQKEGITYIFPGGGGLIQHEPQNWGNFTYLHLVLESLEVQEVWEALHISSKHFSAGFSKWKAFCPGSNR